MNKIIPLRPKSIRNELNNSLQKATVKDEVSSNSDTSGKTNNTADFSFIPANIQRFFLNDVPAWANFSSAGKCHRPTNIHYLNLPRVQSELGLSYQEALQLQLLFNANLLSPENVYDKGKAPNGEKDLRNHEYIFHLSLEQIIGKNYLFKVPEYSKIVFIWIDPYLDFSNQDLQKKQLAQLAQVVNDQLAIQGQPLFFSFCLTYKALENLLAQAQLDLPGSSILSYELLTVYNEQAQVISSFQIDLNQFFHHKQELTIFWPQDFAQRQYQMPNELKNKFWKNNKNKNKNL